MAKKQNSEIIIPKSQNLDWIENAWLGLGDYTGLEYDNPLANRTEAEKEMPGLREVGLMRNKDYLAFACKTLLSMDGITPLDLLPMQAAILEELWIRPFPMFIGSRGVSKTTSLAIYALLRCALTPGTKVVGVGAGFRQSKMIFEKAEEIFNNSPVLRSICDNSSGAKREPDKLILKINDSSLIALPVGDGSRIRGYRANIICCDEFGCLEKNTLIQTTNGLIKIKDYLSGDYYGLINKDGEVEYPDIIYITPPVDVYQITTECGFTFKCSEIHQVMTSKGWKIAKDLTKADFLDMDSNDYFPERYIESDDYTLDEKMGYLLGLLISEGTCTNRNYLDITTTDEDFKNRFILENPSWSCYEREAYTDTRGWNCKKSYILKLCDTKLREWLYSIGLDYVIANHKTIPWGILQSPKSVIIAFLKGLFYGDGSCFLYEDKNGKNNIGINYYSSSEELINQIKILLLKFRISTTKTIKGSKISDNLNWMLTTRAEGAINLYKLLKIERWESKIKVGDYRIRKPFIKKNGKRYTVETTRNNKNVYLGTFDSEEECRTEFNKFWENAKISFRVKSVEKLPDKEVLYDFHLPKTHSFIGNGFIQHNSMSPEIYEVVISGFAAVEASPVKGVKESARRKALKSLNLWSDEQEELYDTRPTNQSIISGTATWSFNHFYDYWKRYKSIIESKGDINKLKDILGEIPEGFNWKDYSVIRIPFEIIPHGFMNEGIVARAKATAGTDAYLREYSACFSDDSDGFFKRSMIEACVTSDSKPIELPSGPVWFDPLIRGNPSKKYVYGIDPSIGSSVGAETDNFTICILELNEDHTRIVYMWSTSRNEFRRRLNAGNIKENQFYAFCSRKIRDLMKVFPCEHICLDALGGGVLMYEALNDENNMHPGESKIWEIIEDGKEKDSDGKSGLHILEFCQFSKYEWLKEANYGMHKDFSNKVLLFPRYDVISLGLAAEEDAQRMADYQKKNPNKKIVLMDTFEDCVMEIEELKNELSSIVVTVVGSGVNVRERWDTPEVKTASGKKGRMRKDRYSALLMANAAARKIHRADAPLDYRVVGGRVGVISSGGHSEQLYYGPDWYTQAISEDMFGAVVRSRD